MDTLIGEPGSIGRGHAPVHIRQRASMLRAGGTTAVTAGRELANPRAIRPLRSAGFAGDRVVAGEGGRPVLLLSLAAAVEAA